MKKPLISLIQVNKFYDLGEFRLQVLTNISFEVQEGEFLSIVGASGSGKSTLLNILGCLDRPSTGKYSLGGEEVSEFDDDKSSFVRNRSIGFVFQSFQLIQQLTVLENVEVPLFYAGIPGKKRNEIGKRFLERVGMSHRLDHLPSQLSGGEQQRVAIARALVNDPLLILADEPTGNLDSKNGKEVLNLLLNLHREGKTVILVTHNPEIARFTKRQIEIQDGKILRDRVKTDGDRELVSQEG